MHAQAAAPASASPAPSSPVTSPRQGPPTYQDPTYQDLRPLQSPSSGKPSSPARHGPSPKRKPGAGPRSGGHKPTLVSDPEAKHGEAARSGTGQRASYAALDSRGQAGQAAASGSADGTEEESSVGLLLLLAPLVLVVVVKASCFTSWGKAVPPPSDGGVQLPRKKSADQRRDHFAAKCTLLSSQDDDGCSPGLHATSGYYEDPREVERSAEQSSARPGAGRNGSTPKRSGGHSGSKVAHQGVNRSSNPWV